MSPWAQELAVELCAEHAGLGLAAFSAVQFETTLAPLARREGFSSVDALLSAVRDRDDMKIAWRVIEALAPARGVFFAQPEVLEHLCDVVLPDMAAQAPERRLRLWVAGCGAGQEAYSLAMALEEREPRIDAEIFASDLSEARLEKAQAGHYSAWEVQRGLSARRLVRCFETYEGAYVLSPRLRRSIRWSRVDMLQDAARHGRFDVILCRGLLPCLTEEAHPRVAESLAAALRPGGRIVLGSSETPPRAWTAQAGPPGFFAPADVEYLAA